LLETDASGLGGYLLLADNVSMFMFVLLSLERKMADLLVCHFHFVLLDYWWVEIML
jgi:hypothetical protein